MQNITYKSDNYNQEEIQRNEITSSLQNNSNFLTYGSIVSIVFDHIDPKPLKILDYDSDEEKKKFHSFNRSIEENMKNMELEKKRSNSYLKKIKDNKGENQKKNEELNYFLGKSFIFSKGFFNKKLVLYEFSDILDVELNYKNTLFRIIHAGEYEYKNKLKQNIKEINAEDDENCKHICDLFSKFKQESLSNNENFKFNLENKSPINFDDSIQFLHMQSGKFLKFTKKNEDTEVHLYLSNEPSTDTIFRIRPAFSYQIENATNLFFNLSISIACGNKSSVHEMCLNGNNSSKKSQGINRKQNTDRNDDENTFLKELNNDDQIRLKSEDRLLIDEEKPVNNLRNSQGDFIICGHSNLNRWKFFKFSNNYVDDDLYLNNYDKFWIKNCEKEVYVVSKEEEKNKFFLNELISSFKIADKSEKYPVINKNNYEVIKHGDIFTFSYEFIKSIQSDKKFSLNIRNSDLNLHNSPHGLFVLEKVDNNFSNDFGYSIKIPPDIGPSNYKEFYKIRNVFTNTIIAIDENNFKLKLVPHEEVKNIENCLFMIEQLYVMKNECQPKIIRNNRVVKSDMFRFKSRKFNSYIAIKNTNFNPEKTDYRQEKIDNKLEMILTQNLADLTIFKFEFISNEEKNLVNFFYELNYILDMFIQKDILFQFFNNEKDLIDKWRHIFKILQNTLKYYKIENNLFNYDDNLKIDVINNLIEFSIVEKLLKLLVNFWFKRDIKDTYIEKEILNEKQKNFELKKECTDDLINLLTLIYDIDKSILETIKRTIESVTYFLIHILRDNESLMLKLLSHSDEDVKNQVINSIKNLFYLKEIKDDEKVDLFFNLLNVILICNDRPFNSFYKDTILQFEVVKFENDQVINNTNYWFIGDFELYRDFDIIIFVMKIEETPNNYKCFKFDINFIDYKENDQILKNRLMTLAACNIGMYADLSLHDKRIRDKLKKIFRFDLLNKYINLYEKKEKISLWDDKILSMLIKMVECLYLKLNQNIVQKFKLCRIVNNDKFPIIKDILENLKQEFNEFYDKVYKQIEMRMSDNNHKSSTMLNLINSSHYLLKNIYLQEIKQKIFDINDKNSQKGKIFKLISLLLTVLERMNSKHNKSMKKSEELEKEIGKFNFWGIFSGAKMGIVKKVNSKKENKLEFLHELRNDVFSNQKIADSPYLKIYENFKRKIIHKFVSKDEKGKINSQENRSKMQKSKDINIQIIKRICQIYIEFVQFLEFYMFSQIEKKLVKKIKNIPRFDILDHYESLRLIRNLLGFDKEDIPSYLCILDEFAYFHSKNILNKIKHETNYLFSISNIFLDCLQEENMEIKIIIFDVIYRINSQKLFFFENLSNLVILTEDSECLVFESISELIDKIILEVDNFNENSFYDDSMNSSVKNIKTNFEELIKLLVKEIKFEIKTHKINDDEYANLFPIIKNESNAADILNDTKINKKEIFEKKK